MELPGKILIFLRLWILTEFWLYFDWILATFCGRKRTQLHQKCNKHGLWIDQNGTLRETTWKSAYVVYIQSNKRKCAQCRIPSQSIAIFDGAPLLKSIRKSIKINEAFTHSLFHCAMWWQFFTLNLPIRAHWVVLLYSDSSHWKKAFDKNFLSLNEIDQKRIKMTSNFGSIIIG